MTIGVAYDRFRARKDHLDAFELLCARARDLCARVGRPDDERTRSVERASEDSLKPEARRLRIAVVGEFSRGKSMLLNALMGLRLLPTDLRQTTAINTFLRGAAEGEEERIVVHKSDGTTLTLALTETALVAWGTELDRQKRDARREVLRIEVFLRHELLKLDVELIDTPGFEGLLPEHEAIAREAMDRAHVAIWVQAANQLGGTAREWLFLNQVLVKNFRRFLTVINWWDLVLEPSDEASRARPVEERILAALGTVRRNFQEQAQGISQEQLDVLTSRENLLGVSAEWALSSDPIRRERAGIATLARRIEALCGVDGEARHEIVAKPLLAIRTRVEEAAAEVRAAFADLEQPLEVAELGAQKAKLELENERARNDQKARIDDARLEHGAAQHELLERLHQAVVVPIGPAVAAAESVTAADVLARLRAGDRSIGLPPHVQAKVDAGLSVQRAWDGLRGDVDKSLAELRQGYETELAKGQKRIQEALGGIKVELPSTRVQADVDLGVLEEHDARRAELEREIRELARTHDELLLKEEHATALREAVVALERSLARLEAQRAGLGAPPSPLIYTRQREVKRSHWYFWTKTDYVPETVIDRRGVEEHEQARRRLDTLCESQEIEIQKLMKDSRYSMPLDRARQKVERDIETARRRVAEAQANVDTNRASAAEQCVEGLKGQVRDAAERARAAHASIKRAIEGAFKVQLEELARVYRATIDDPMRARIARLEHLENAIRAGEAARAKAREQQSALLSEAATLLSDIQALQTMVEARS